MKSSLFKSAAAPLLALLMMAGTVFAHDNDHGHHQNIPGDLVPPVGNVVQFKVKGVGVQIYGWTQNPTNATQFSWVNKAPHAILLHDHEGIVGIHFAGPNWEANDGSRVTGSKMAGVTVDPTAIQWLLLNASGHAGNGVFSSTTYIQRLFTEGGLPPTTAGSFVGEEALSPYIAEYVFYRAK